MRRVAQAVVVVVALACVSGCGSDGSGTTASRLTTSGKLLGFTPYWVGESFTGLTLRDSGAATDGIVSLVYGTCTPPSDGGCAPPLEIQTDSICERNPVLLDLRPQSTRRVRGAVVRTYRDGDLELAAGDANVTIFARSAALRRRVLAALRPAGTERAARLPRARYSRAYVVELRRVQAAYRRLGSVRAVRGALRISQSAVRFRLALARELGSRRIRRPAGEFRSNGRCAVEPGSA